MTAIWGICTAWLLNGMPTSGLLLWERNTVLIYLSYYWFVCFFWQPKLILTINRTVLPKGSAVFRLSRNTCYTAFRAIGFHTIPPSQPSFSVTLPFHTIPLNSLFAYVRRVSVACKQRTLIKPFCTLWKIWRVLGLSVDCMNKRKKLPRTQNSSLNQRA